MCYRLGIQSVRLLNVSGVTKAQGRRASFPEATVSSLNSVGMSSTLVIMLNLSDQLAAMLLANSTTHHY